MSYQVSEWSSDVHGDVYAVAQTPEEAAFAALELASSGSTAQISHPSWRGEVLTFLAAEGFSVAAKRFAGCDEWGFGGQIPADAEAVCAAIQAGLAKPEFTV